MKSLYLGLLILILLVLFWYAQQPEKYIFVQGLDSGFDDSANIIPPSPVSDTPVDQLKSMCDKLSGCVGFNTNGWMKNKLKPLADFNKWTDDPSKGFYYKKSALPVAN